MIFRRKFKEILWEQILYPYRLSSSFIFLSFQRESEGELEEIVVIYNFNTKKPKWCVSKAVGNKCAFKGVSIDKETEKLFIEKAKKILKEKFGLEIK